MKLPPSLSDEDAADIALSLSPLERSVICRCFKGKGWTYREIARQLNLSYLDVQEVGHKLQRTRLAHVSVVPYDGSRMVLNDRGERVKHAVEVLAKIRNRT